MQRAAKSALVSTKWLQDVLSSNPSNYRILDATWHIPFTGRDAAEEFKLKHIPRARFFDIFECADKSNPLPFTVPPADVFEDWVGNLGINNDTHVIIYDNCPDYPMYSAQRAWWTFRLFDHQKVSVLDGGLKKWIAEDGHTTSEIEDVSKEKYEARFQPHLIKNYSDILQNMKDSAFQLVDVRPARRFNGIDPEAVEGVKAGHMPNSTNIPFSSLLDMDNQCLKSPDQLRRIFSDHGVDLNKPLVATCSVGLTANALVLAAYECGNDQVANYDGSWCEWYLMAPDEYKLSVPKGPDSE